MFAFHNNIRTLLLIVFVAVIWADQKEVEKPQIDYLTQEYLFLEQELWTEIGSSDDTKALLSSVFDEHRRFIRYDFGVSRNTLEIYIPTGILIDNLRNINDLFYNVSNFLINNTPDDVNRLNIYYVNQILRDAIAYSEHVFREAMRAEFWEKGKDVSEPLIEILFNC